MSRCDLAVVYLAGGFRWRCHKPDLHVPPQTATLELLFLGWSETNVSRKTVAIDKLIPLNQGYLCWCGQSFDPINFTSGKLVGRWSSGVKRGHAAHVFTGGPSLRIKPEAHRWFTSCHFVVWVSRPTLKHNQRRALLARLRAFLRTCLNMCLWTCHTLKSLLPSKNKWRLIWLMGSKSTTTWRVTPRDTGVWPTCRSAWFCLFLIVV